MRRLWQVCRGFLLFPWVVLCAGLGGSRRVLLSLRTWVLLLLGVIAALVAYYVLSDRYTPFTTDAYVQAYVIQVAPRVAGQVVAVHVQENQAVRKGQLLFEIDPRPFEHRAAYLEASRREAIQLVAQMQANREEAIFQVKQMESELAAARAEDARLVAEEAYARAVHEQEKEIFTQDATTDRKYLDAVAKYKAAQAARERGLAQTRKAEQALAAKIGEEHARVAAAQARIGEAQARIAAVEAQLKEARLNLEWTRVEAPANGYVTNVQLREGFYIHVGTPVLTCIDSDHWWVVANYRENSLEHIQPGQPAGLTLNTYPGRIFPGVV